MPKVIVLLLLTCLSSVTIDAADTIKLLTAEQIDNHQMRTYRKTAVFIKYNIDFVKQSDAILRGWASMNDRKGYENIARDEFAWDDAKQQVISQLAEQLKPVSTTFTRRYPVYVGEYNSSKSGFPIKGGRKNPVIQQRFRGDYLTFYSGRPIKAKKNDPAKDLIKASQGFVWFELDRPVGLDFLNATRENAKSLVQQMNKGGNKRRQLYIVVKFDVVDAKYVKQRGRHNVAMKSKVVSVELQDKKENMIAELFKI